MKISRVGGSKDFFEHTIKHLWLYIGTSIAELPNFARERFYSNNYIYISDYPVLPGCYLSKSTLSMQEKHSITMKLTLIFVVFGYFYMQAIPIEYYSKLY